MTTKPTWNSQPPGNSEMKSILILYSFLTNISCYPRCLPPSSCQASFFQVPRDLPSYTFHWSPQSFSLPVSDGEVIYYAPLLHSLAVWSHRFFSGLYSWCGTCGLSGYRQWYWWPPWKFKPQPRLQSQYARLSFSLASGPHYPVTEWTKLSLDVEDFYGALTLSTIVMAHEINSSQFKARWNRFCQNYAHGSLEQMNKNNKTL